MKKIFMLFVSLTIGFGVFGCVTVTPLSVQHRTVQRVVELPGMSKKEIHSKSIEWFAMTFKSAKAVLQHTESSIIGNFVTYANDNEIGLSKATVEGRIIVNAKKDKARIRLTAGTMRNLQGQSWGILTKYYIEDVQTSYHNLIQNYKDYMMSKTKDW